MNDYTELLRLSKKAADAWRNDDSYYQAAVIIDSLCETVDTLKQERDALIEELRGICWCCSSGEKWGKAPPYSKLTTCEHMRETGKLAHNGRMDKCQHWQWRGIGGSDGTIDTKR